MTTRRGFLGAMLAAAAAPAFVKAEILMPVRKLIAPATEIILPSGLVLWGDGIHDDTAALQAAIRGERVIRPDGSGVFQGDALMLLGGAYKLSDTLHIRQEDKSVQMVGCHFEGSGIQRGPAIHFDHGALGRIENTSVTGVANGGAYSVNAPHALSVERRPVQTSRLLDSMIARLYP